ncbi:MAG: YtxH domain-containing protein [Actinomycetota bacterium]
MRGRLGLFLGFGAGYVLGAKAGRERYEQLRRLYDNLQASPAFQKATGRAKDAVGTGLGSAKDMASEGMHKVSDAVKDRRSTPSGLSVAHPPQ